MNVLTIVTGAVALTLVPGCADREAEARRARQKEEAEVRARAEAARKEMEALPKAFTSPPFFQRNVSGDQPEPPPTAAPKP